MLDYSRYYRAYAEMRQTLDGDFAKEYFTGALKDSDQGKDILAGNAYNRVIDMDWVEKIEETLPYMDKAIREERRFIETYEEVDRVDKVKQVTKEAVRHLTQHTNLIQAVDPDGLVSPSKLLNTHREDSYATYENRFLYTLIFKTISFVEARFRALKEAPNDSYTSVEMKRYANMNNQKFAFNLTYASESHERDKVDKEEDVSNLTDYERITRIRMMLDDFVNTNLIQALKGCIQVRSPINKTNCIKKNPNFSKCNELWSFIEAYRKTGYVVESNEFSGEMDADTQSELYEVMAFQHFVMTISTNKALKDKLHAEYEAENERRAREANKPQEEQAKWLEDQIYEARREEMALRLKEVRERDLLIAQLTTELDQEKEKVRQRDLKIKELQTLLDIREKELQETKEELRIALQRVAELEAELEKAKAYIAELEAKVEEQARIIEAQAATIAALEAKIVELNNLIDELNAKIDELNAKIAELEAVIEQQKQRIKALEEEVDFLKDRISVLETTIRDLQAEIAEHKARIAELEALCASQAATIAAQEQEISTLNDNVSELESKNQALNNENDSLKITITQHENTIATQKADIEDKKQQINTANTQISSLSSHLDTLQGDFDTLKVDCENQKSKVSQLTTEVADSKSLNEKLSSEIKTHLETISAKDSDIKSLKNSNSSLQSKLDNNEHLIAKNNEKTAKLEEQLKKSKDDYSALNDTIAIHISNIKERDKQIKQQNAAIKSANKDKDAAVSDITVKYETQLKELRAMYEKQLADKDKEIAAANSFTDEQKYESRLNLATKAMQKDYDEKLKKAKKKAKAYVKKARVLIDYKPSKVLELDGADEYL